MRKPNTPGRPPTVESDAASLLLSVFATYQEAAAEFKCTRSAVQSWAARNRIPGDRLLVIRDRAAAKRTTTRLFNRLGKTYGVTIGH